MRSSRLPSPPARRGPRVDAGGGAAPACPPRTDPGRAPFDRVNQDCVDIIVEYAADSPDVLLQLRLASAACAEGVSNLFALVCRHDGTPPAEAGSMALLPARYEAMLRHMAGGDGGVAQEGSAVDMQALLLSALYLSPQLTSLQFFSSGALQGIRGEDLMRLVRCLTRGAPALEAITVNSSHFTDDMLAVAVEHRPRELRSLEVWFCEELAGPGLACVAACCPGLERLAVTCAGVVCAGMLRVIGRCFPRLRELELRHALRWYDCDDAAIMCLFANLEKLCLGFLAYRNAEEPFGSAVAAFVDGCPALTDLDVSGTCASGRACLAIAKCASLRILDVSETNINRVGVRATPIRRQRCPFIVCLTSAPLIFARGDGFPDFSPRGGPLLSKTGHTP